MPILLSYVYIYFCAHINFKNDFLNRAVVSDKDLAVPEEHNEKIVGIYMAWEVKKKDPKVM